MRLLFVALLFVAAALSLAVTARAEDFYQLLGVGRDAKDAEIRSKFKALARKYHPDASRDLPEAAKEANRVMYTKVADAYETLLDPARRSRYDQGARGHHVMEKPNVNYLRNNLFSDNFDGDQIGLSEIQHAMRGGEKKGMMVFFWSNNFPACVDAGLEYKKAAARLKMGSMRIAALRCDDYVNVCRDILRIPGAPSIVLFPPAARDNWVRYEKAYEGQLIVDFAMGYAKAPGSRIDVSMNALMARTPRVEATIAAMPLGMPSVYMYETMKKSFGATMLYDFVVLEHSACADCGTELTLALENYKYYNTRPVVRRVECGDAMGLSADLCDEGAERDRNKAWSVLRVARRCFYATKKPFSFSNEHCDETIEWYSGRYQSAEFLDFLMRNASTKAVERITSFEAVRRSNDSFVLMYADTDNVLSLGRDGMTWLFLAARAANFPIIGEKGWRVRVGIVNCAKVSGCPAHNRPWAAQLSFGLKAKLVEPREVPIQSVPNMVKHIRREMEPLHLHILTPSTFSVRMAEGYKRGRAWIVLFNAGQWCPPCMQVKPHWPAATRAIQQSATLKKKLSVALVDCDQYPKLCQREKIDGFPAIFMYPGKDKPRRAFNGNKHSDAIVQWATESLESNVQKMDYHTLMHHINNQIPVLSSFTAGQWCPPCNMLGPVLKQLSNKMPSLAVNEINCDNDQRYCQMFQIDGFPTLNLYYKGQKHNFNAYQKSANDIAAWIRKTTGQKFS